ncbi:MAG: M20/M25/M40 family metallo-hydrolase [Planctomycetes bacterium]|nr:M20/M25/M40 family metallo-hydrolase [Planctomycetota bacterium]
MALTDTERRLCDLVKARSDLLLKQLAEHVAIPTGRNYTPGLDRYRDLLAERLSALGAVIKHMPGEPRPKWLETPGESSAGPSIPPTLVAKHRVDSATPRILIVGHLDTVHDPEDSFCELTVSSDGKIATGPGAVDMKGGVLIAVTALEMLAEAGVELNWTMLLNSDEETGSFHSEAALREAASEHDLGIVLEPALADGALVIERVGSGQFMVEVFGRAAHVGRNFAEGRSAVNELAAIVGRLAGASAPHRGEIVNVGPLRGGSVTNTVPDRAAGWGNVRYVDPAAGDRLAALIDGLATPDDAMPRVVVRRSWNRPVKPLTAAVRGLAESVRAAASDLGQPLSFASTGGVCDGNILQDAGLPTLDTLGVRGGNLHRDDEFIEIASLVDRCQLLAVLLARLADGRVRLAGRDAGARSDRPHPNPLPGGEGT